MLDTALFPSNPIIISKYKLVGALESQAPATRELTEYQLFESVDTRACKITQQCHPCKFLHIPAEADFSSPITITPAAEPMISMEPPTPAQ